MSAVKDILPSECIRTNRNCEFYTFTEITDETKPIYHLDKSPERYKEALLKK